MAASSASPADTDFPAWFRLAHSPGLSRSAARTLLAAFGSPTAVLDAPPAALREVVPARALAALDDAPAERRAALQAALQWLGGGAGRAVIPLDDPRYPASLLQTADPPLLLYAEGDLRLARADGIAVVGSRRATPAGTEHARRFAADLASRGWVVVSGLARGIDAAAHAGALDAGGATVAVVGTGPDQVYPAAHRALAQRIRDGGLLLSEFPPGTPPLATNFPQRNRIIAGLCRGVLVVEAALQSGSLITARLAAEAGREVFALPGPIDSPQARGCHALIKQGAKLVESVEDIIEEFTPRQAMAAAAAADTEPGDADAVAQDDAVLRALGHAPTTLDALCARTGWPVSELAARLLEHELRGDVARPPGGLSQRPRRA